MVGDQKDIADRLKTVIPASWFPNPNAPNEFALLQAFSNVAAFIYGLAVFAKLQTRISTASGFFLDLMAFDFFGRTFARGAIQSDDSFRAGIKAQLLIAKATRPGLIAALTQLTGRAPKIFYPSSSLDTGGYGITSTVAPGFVMGYGLSGFYGSMLMPFQALVTAFRPGTSGIPNIPGYGSRTAAAGFFIAGYGITGEYADISNIIGAVTDAEIFAAVSNTAPVGTVPWTRISN